MKRDEVDRLLMDTTNALITVRIALRASPWSEPEKPPRNPDADLEELMAQLYLLSRTPDVSGAEAETLESARTAIERIQHRRWVRERPRGLTPGS